MLGGPERDVLNQALEKYRPGQGEFSPESVGYCDRGDYQEDRLEDRNSVAGKMKHRRVVSVTFAIEVKAPKGD
jgi:hypothetical protein